MRVNSQDFHSVTHRNADALSGWPLTRGARDVSGTAPRTPFATRCGPSAKRLPETSRSANGSEGIYSLYDGLIFEHRYQNYIKYGKVS
jgi:hypothetical protein